MSATAMDTSLPESFLQAFANLTIGTATDRILPQPSTTPSTVYGHLYQPQERIYISAVEECYHKTIGSFSKSATGEEWLAKYQEQAKKGQDALFDEFMRQSTFYKPVDEKPMAIPIGGQPNKRPKRPDYIPALKPRLAPRCNSGSADSAKTVPPSVTHRVNRDGATKSPMKMKFRKGSHLAKTDWARPAPYRKAAPQAVLLQTGTAEPKAAKKEDRGRNFKMFFNRAAPAAAAEQPTTKVEPKSGNAPKPIKLVPITMTRLEYTKRKRDEGEECEEENACEASMKRPRHAHPVAPKARVAKGAAAMRPQNRSGVFRARGWGVDLLAVAAASVVAWFTAKNIIGDYSPFNPAPTQCLI
jgi:hypothetical protein